MRLILATMVSATLGGPQLMAAANPEITVEAHGLTVQAFLLNPGSSGIWFLHQPKLQFSFLRLTNQSGVQLKPENRMEAAKADGTILKDAFTHVASGARLPLMESRFVSGPLGYSLAWGPWVYEKLPSGLYLLQLEFTSSIDYALEPPAYKPDRLKNVWKGTALSKPVEVRLPAVH